MLRGERKNTLSVLDRVVEFEFLVGEERTLVAYGEVMPFPDTHQRVVIEVASVAVAGEEGKRVELIFIVLATRYLDILLCVVIDEEAVPAVVFVSGWQFRIGLGGYLVASEIGVSGGVFPIALLSGEYFILGVVTSPDHGATSVLGGEKVFHGTAERVADVAMFHELESDKGVEHFAVFQRVSYLEVVREESGDWLLVRGREVVSVLVIASVEFLDVSFLAEDCRNEILSHSVSIFRG